MEENFFIVAAMGQKKRKIYLDHSSYLTDLFLKVEEMFSVDRNSQKIIFKGRVLTDREATLKSLGIHKGDTLMVLGKVIHTERDNLLEELDKFEQQYKEEETAVVKTLSAVGSPSSKDCSKEKLKQSMKKLLYSNEKLMKLLETIDGMQMTVSCNDVRTKRKAIVQNIQKLMDKVDKDYSYLETYVNAPS